MDQPIRPDDATQGASPAAASPSESMSPATTSPASPSTASWAAPLEPIGPAPGLRFASHGGRLVAYIVDVILVGALVTIVAVLLSFGVAAFAVAGAETLAALSGLFVLLAVVAVSIGYFPWFWVKGGATPGMRIYNLRVVRDRDGGPIGWREAFLRLVGYWVSSVAFYLGFAWILIDKRRRGWHDLIAGTVMVQPE